MKFRNMGRIMWGLEGYLSNYCLILQYTAEDFFSWLWKYILELLGHIQLTQSTGSWIVITVYSYFLAGDRLLLSSVQSFYRNSTVKNGVLCYNTLGEGTISTPLFEPLYILQSSRNKWLYIHFTKKICCR